MSPFITMHKDDPKRRYSFPDPHFAPLLEAIHRCHWAPEDVTKADLSCLTRVAEAYEHLLTHPAGTGSAVRQLREVRRAIRERQPEEPKP